MSTNFYDVALLAEVLPLIGFLVFFHVYLYNYCYTSVFVLSKKFINPGDYKNF